MECPKCNNQLADTAKFCGKCGTKIEGSTITSPIPVVNTCQHCGKELKPGARFCGKCGKPNENQPAQEDNPTKGFITWEMQPAQIALRLTENIFSQYTRAQGVVIPEGYMVMILCGGKLQSMMEAGIYKFEKKPTDIPNPVTGIVSFFANLFRSRKKYDNERNQRDADAVSQSVHKRVPVEMIVCRSSEFTLPFNLKQVPTGTIRVDTAILVSMQVSNLLDLYKRFMIDKTVLAADTFAQEILPYIESAVKQSFSQADPETIAGDDGLKATLAEKLSSEFASRFPYLQFLDIVKIETAREELQRLQHLSEEMYLSERELEQLSRRNEFMNRLSQEQSNAELQNATNAAEFNRRLAEINRDNLLTQEEFTNLQRDIEERSEDHQFNRAMAIELMVAQHQHNMQEARIKVEEELGSRLFNLELERRRQQDDYSDQRRRKEMDLDKDEQLGQLDILKQAQEIRQQREQAEHQRKLEEKRLEQTHEMDKLHMFKGMTAEQIMVANPSINAEAAKAMAEKFKAEAATMASDTRARDAQDQLRMMKEFMEQQMQVVRDMSVANTQAIGGLMGSKEREIERTQHIMDKNEDRYASLLKEQVKSGAKQVVVICNQCGLKSSDEAFCPDCGARLPEK